MGLRFRPRDARSLEAALEQILTDDEARAQLVAEAREHVLRFDWGEVARRTEGIYDALVGATSSASAARP